MTIEIQNGIPFIHGKLAAITQDASPAILFIVLDSFSIVLSPIFPVLWIFIAPCGKSFSSFLWVCLCPLFVLFIALFLMCVFPIQIYFPESGGMLGLPIFH